MADNVNDDNNDPKEHEEEFGEEFDFESGSEVDPLAPEDSEGAEETSMEPPPVKHKNIMLPMVIGIVVVGFIGWKVYSMLSAPKELPTDLGEKLPPKQQTVSPKVDLQPQKAIPNLEEAQQQAKLAQSEEAVTTKLQKKLDELQATNKQQIDALHRDLSIAQQNAANATKNLATMQHDVQTLSATVQELTAQIKAIRDDQLALIAKEEERQQKARQKAKPKSQKISPKSAAFTTPHLTVHAIIPGRAWIRTADGKTITITEGDTVGEYGKVLKIDAPNGVVLTSSGVTLR
ncbi:MAG: hypothetical protein HYX61_02600 [Gammaproteobacteria bacterium]|jgi:hypothetical protein|nr:hypothetical protein [Gammaproteobacteria bacterium]